MSLRRRVKRLVERLTGTRIYGWAPRGVELFRDLEDHLPGYRPGVVLDVGANVGQSALAFLRLQPVPRILCFEPTRNTFARLRDAMRAHPEVECHRLAFGAERGTGHMVLHGTSEMHFVTDDPAAAPDGADLGTEPVTIETLDGFCDAHGIGHVGLLKVDTEGADLDVLKGAAALLDAQRIDLVQVEAGMHPGNDRHVPFEALKGFLESHGYLLFGIYEQVQEWTTGAPHLRRTNPVFISPRLIAAHT